jgi:DNA polymerase-1
MQAKPLIGKQATSPRQYHLIQDMELLQQIIAEIKQAGIVAFDTETTSLDAIQAELVGISLCTQAGTAYYIPLAHKTPQSGMLSFEGQQNETLKQLPFNDVINILKPILEAPEVLKIGQNIKYDMQVMRKCGVEISPFDDTMILSYCLNAGLNLHGLDALAERLLGIETIKYKDVTGSGKAQKCFSEVDLAQACNYAAEDADITLQLHQILKPQLIANGLTTLYERIERPCVPVIARMEAHGVRIDALYLAQLSKQFAALMQDLEAEIYSLVGAEFNIGSPKQLGEILFEKMQIAGGKKSSKTGAYVTDSETLEELAGQGHQLPAKVIEWRQLAKLKSTYTDSLPKQINPRTKRVHTSYSLASTTTGRLSSNEPNLQNIPIRTKQGRLIREAFIAADGFELMTMDYSQIELRLLAHIANITPLKEAFAQGIDVHAVTASQMFNVPLDEVDFELRRKAKTINFGIIYGISAHGLAARLNIPRGVAAEYINAYFKQYAGIAEYMAQCKEQAKANGYVETLWGRRCHLPMINDKNGARRAFAERAAINAPLQGSAADIIKLAMIAVDELLQQSNVQTRMLLQVHDELVFELHEQEHHLIPQIKQAMEQVAHLSVPLLVEVGRGRNWGEAH